MLEDEPVAAGAALLAAHRAGLAPPRTLQTGPVAGTPAPTYDALYDRFVTAALEGAP
ncbi:hypothetical protein [Georgenia faecalis]|uniref:Uncharacterized protein n=1 Tax=Georgenia faecalis TaxID=2483799 RepID=A0ABV9D6D8_9MICO|nr:hypothetical protein [Georgenia faecalis]